jgi:hypothetical protein
VRYQTTVPPSNDGPAPYRRTCPLLWRRKSAWANDGASRSGIGSTRPFSHFPWRAMSRAGPLDRDDGDRSPRKNAKEPADHGRRRRARRRFDHDRIARPEKGRPDLGRNAPAHHGGGRRARLRPRPDGRHTLLEALRLRRHADPSINNSNFSDTVRGISEAIEGSGLQLLLGRTDYLVEKEETLLESMLTRRPEGIILTGGSHTPRSRRLLESAGIPIIETWDLPEEADRACGRLFQRGGDACPGARPFCARIPQYRLHRRHHQSRHARRRPPRRL